MVRADSRIGRLVRALAAEPPTAAHHRHGIIRALAAQPGPPTVHGHARSSGATAALRRWRGLGVPHRLAFRKARAGRSGWLIVNLLVAVVVVIAITVLLEALLP